MAHPVLYRRYRHPVVQAGRCKGMPEGMRADASTCVSHDLVLREQLFEVSPQVAVAEPYPGCGREDVLSSGAGGRPTALDDCLDFRCHRNISADAPLWLPVVVRLDPNVTVANLREGQVNH